MNIRETKVTVFAVEDKGAYIKADVSEGKKDRDGNWHNMYWRALFFGQCKDRAKKLNDKDRIKITSAFIENIYDKELKKGYTRLKVFDFE